MTGADKLPSFLVIGAVKAATTWLTVQLQENPGIFMPNPEPHFFSNEYHRGLDHYRHLFSAAAPGQLIGEKSADYLAHPEAPHRAAELLPKARLVVLLRDPVERAYSDYKMLYRRGTIRGLPDEWLRPGSSQTRFLEGGRYAHHLRRWLDHFDHSQLCALLYDDARTSPRETLATVCSHIGIASNYSERIGSKAVNNGSARLLPLGVRKWLAPLKPFAQPLRGTAGFEKVRGLLAREVRYPPLLPETRARLREFYARDVEQLTEMIGRDLGHWLEPKRMAA